METDSKILPIEKNNSLLRTEGKITAVEESQTVTRLDLRPSISIQGGYQAADGLRRYMAWTGRCSGLVISRRWVMTAAHCRTPPGTNVWFGLPQVGAPGASVRVRRTFDHPNFPQGNRAHFDAAVLELESDAPPGTLFMRVNRRAFFPAANAPVRALGYGAFSNSGRDGILRQVDLRVQDPLSCAAQQVSVSGIFNNPALTVCVISPGGSCGSWYVYGNLTTAMDDENEVD